MRSSFSLLAAALLLAGAFTGCLGEDGGDAPATAATNESADLMANMTNESMDAQTGELVGDAGHQPHIHDYWKGKERVTLMDEDVQVDPFTAMGFTFFDVVMGTPGVGGTFVQLPDGAIVYEGTGQLDFTVSWTDPTITGVGLRYRTPADASFTPIQPLSQAQPLTIDVSPEMTDMPHAKTTRWGFLLMPAAAGNMVVGKLHVKVEIVKMRDITLFPGHPELFGGQHSLTLFDGAAQSSQSSFATAFVTQVSGGGTPASERGFASGKVLPMEAMSITANVTISSATAGTGTVSNVSFLYKTADSNFFRRAQMLSGDLESGVFQFGIPVDMRQTDSPYAKESQWRFDMRVSTDPVGNGVIDQCGGCSDAKVDYTATLVAYDSLLPGIAPLDEDGRGGD